MGAFAGPGRVSVYVGAVFIILRVTLSPTRFDLSSDVWDVRRESLRAGLMRKQSFLKLGFCSRDSLGQASFQGGRGADP